MATGKIELNGIKFEPLTVNFTVYNCSGTIAIPNILYIFTDEKFLYCTGTRIVISNFSRTGGYPGITANTNIIPTKSIINYCGIRFDNTIAKPEVVYFALDQTGTMFFRTTETYSNASGNPLYLMVNSFIVPLN